MTDTLYGAQQPDPKASRAVLIGVHDFAHMPDLPAVHNNIFDLKRVLTDPQLWGIPEGNCTLLPQPATVRDVLQAIRQAAREATDALLLYYAGHGLIGHSDDELWLSLPDTEEGHIETVVPYDWIAHELRVDFETAIARLPSGAREVFVLHDVEGYKHEEIADLLGISPGTSKSQLHRARMALRAYLDR